MKTLYAQEMNSLLKTCGRCYDDAKHERLYFNWTGASIELKFCGTLLMADLSALNGEEPVFSMWNKEPATRQTWPVVGVVIDGNEEKVKKYELTEQENRIILYHGSDATAHTIRIIKLTENFKSYTALHALSFEGKLLEPDGQKRPEIEFIGDSITCGFGNLSDDRSQGFFSYTEDALKTYGMLAAKELEMDYSAICFSGIATTKYGGELVSYAMDELYPYTDRVLSDKLGCSEIEEWDFSRHPKDYVVVNLGTNDSHAVTYGGHNDPDRLFHEGYLRFLKTLRSLNGSQTKIICCLGSMSYYFYDDILRIVEEYKKETGDTEVYCMKFRQMLFFDGFGACDHPSAKTHRKMADELVSFLRSIS